MCEICEDAKFTFGGRGPSLTNLGANIGNIYIANLLVFKSEGKPNEIFPAFGCSISYNDREVYNMRQAINYCPFCGRQLHKNN